MIMSKQQNQIQEQPQKKISLDERISNLKQTVMKNAITLRKKIINGTVFKFQKFSKKQKKVLNWWCDTSPVKDMDGIIADRCNSFWKNCKYVFIFCFMGYDTI